MKNQDKEFRETFIFVCGGYIVTIVFFISLLFNGYLSIHYFNNNNLFLSALSLFSIIILPKSILGFVLVFGRDSGVAFNLSEFIWRFFSRTIRKYNSVNLIRTRDIFIALFKQTIWFVIGIIPIVFFI